MRSHGIKTIREPLRTPVAAGRVRSWVAISAAVILLLPLPAWSQFKEPELIGLVGDGKADWGATLSSDLLEVYWVVIGASDWDIWSARRENVEEPWKDLQSVDIVNTRLAENSPHLSPNGLTLTFSSVNREGGFGKQDLWQTMRASRTDPWQEPVNMGPAINTRGSESGSAFSPDGLEIIYDRGCLSPSKGGNSCRPASFRRSTRASLSDPWSESELMSPRRSGHQVGIGATPSLSPDGLSLYFAKPGEFGGYDIFVSKRVALDALFGSPENLGATVNTWKEDRGPTIAPDGSLYYTHDWTLGGGGGRAKIWRAEAEATANLPGDFNGDGVLDVADIDDLTVQAASGSNLATHDLNSDSLVDAADIRVWAKDLFNTWIGDANLDGQFESSDLIGVLAAGTYEADTDAVWSSGDFNGSGRFDTGDLIDALADGGYEQGARAAVAAVPEPSSGILLVLGLIGLSRIRRATHA